MADIQNERILRGYDPISHSPIPIQVGATFIDPVNNEVYASLEIPSTLATRSTVAAVAADTLILASNTSRKGALFFNDSTATLYLALGIAAASTTSYSVQVAGNGYFELPPQPIYTGDIRGIWSAATGACRVTELS